jgi:hypothetical protein
MDCKEKCRNSIVVDGSIHTAYVFRNTRLDLTNITSTYLGIVMIGIQNVNYLVITIANKIQRIKEKNNKQIEKLEKMNIF